MEEVTEKNSCHNCGSTDHYANSFPKAKKRLYGIERFSEAEIQADYSESDSMGDAIRKNSDDNQDPKSEFLVEYQKETQVKTQDIKLEAGLPQETANKNLCKPTQGAQTS
ncbi:hypothetical protein O181_104607 [Austropuccinia psidii MF-1]|uniref:Uncharacterized protein n=1 Tax=Austropuccinia psidii MF-1 TaxID=1389203 RepID=A0A9Q3PLL8_9BASI|nr:hypothetical protein [Austropuccinia psidii MF-1]